MELNIYIQQLMAISETVKHYVDQELYLPAKAVEEDIDSTGYKNENKVIEDLDTTEVSDKEILNGCYEIILSELQEMGITFHCEIDEILGNFYDAQCIYFLRKIYDLRQLYDRFNKNRTFMNEVLDAVDDDLDTTNKAMQVIVVSHKFYKNDEDIERCVDFLFDKLTNTAAFIKYIHHVADMVEGPEFEDMADPRWVILLTAYIEAGKDKALEIFNMAIAMDADNLDAKALYRDHRLYNMDKLQPANLNKYVSWLQYKDDSDAPAEIAAMVKMFDYQHASVTNHHIEYFRQQPKDYVITKNDMVNMLANICDPGDKHTKTEAADKIRSYYNELSATHDIEEGALGLCLEIINNIEWRAMPDATDDGSEEEE